MNPYPTPAQHALHRQHMYSHHRRDVVSQRTLVVRDTFTDHNTDLAAQGV